MAAPNRPPRHPSSAVAGTIGIGIATAAAYATLHRLGTTSGSTPDERRRSLPGDDVIHDPTLVTNHAATLSAPPEQGWSWLTQVGWHCAGWSTPRWVDRLLFPGTWPSADHVMTRGFFRGLDDRLSA